MSLDTGELLSAIGISVILWWVYDSTGQMMFDILWEEMPRLVP